MKVVELLPIWEALCRHMADPKEEGHPWWDCPNFPPELDDVQKVAASLPENFKIVSNDGNPHLNDRDYHVRQIAALYNWWEDGHPIEVKDGKVMNGGHRIIAARLLGHSDIEIE